MTKTVTIAATRTNGDPYAHHEVIVTLVAGSAGGVVGSSVVVEQSTVKLDANGEGQLDLYTNDVEITDPPESFYRFTVKDSSPTITRSIALTDDLADTVSWTLADIQVGDPVVPERSVAAQYVRMANGQSLPNYLADGIGSGVVPADLLLAVDAVDGTATTFDVLVADQNGAATGDIPANFTSVATANSVATFQGLMTSGLGIGMDDTVNVVVPGGPHFGAYSLTAATVDEPWTPLEGSVAVGRRVAVGWFGVLGSDRWITVLDAEEIAYTGTGMLLGILKVHPALHLIEGILDRWQTVSAMCLTTAIDVNDPDPTMEHGQLVDGARFFLNAQTDPAENGTYFVSGGSAGAWEYAKAPPEGVFDPPGNGYVTHLVAPSDPAHGLMLIWLEDDPTQSFRAGSLVEPAQAEGEWIVVYDPTATGGGLDEGAVQDLIDAAISALLDGAPGALNTLNELAAAINDDASFAASVTTALAGKASTTHNHDATYQPLDSDLTAIAALATTTFGRGLLELASASATRTALGTAYGLTTGTVVEGIALPHATWRTGSYYATSIPFSNSGNAMASGVVRAMPFYNPVSGRSIDQLALDVFSASGTPAGILYVMLDDGTGYPGSVVASGAITPAALSRLTTSVTYALPRGLIWLAAHSTAATWAGLALAGPSMYLPHQATYTANPMNCWSATGAGTSTLTSFPAGATQSASGLQIMMRAA